MTSTDADILSSYGTIILVLAHSDTHEDQRDEIVALTNRLFDHAAALQNGSDDTSTTVALHRQALPFVQAELAFQGLTKSEIAMNVDRWTSQLRATR